MADKKILYIVFFLLITLNLNACSVAMPAKKPEEGVWYCKELGIYIDFSNMKNGPDCATVCVGNECLVVKCYVDFWNGIFIHSKDGEIMYLSGKFEYKEELFIVASFENDTEYVFVRLWE